MKRTIGAIFALVVLAGMLVLAIISKNRVPAVHASPGCTVATLTGNYGFVSINSFFSRTSTSRFLPSGDVGLITFDGGGNLSTTFTDSANGSITTFTAIPGTYTVNSDCTGSTTLTGPGFTVHIQMVIVNGGTEVLSMMTDPGSTSTFDLKKQ